MVAARLSDVMPSDSATRVTYGLLNLTHRNGSAEPVPLQPGRIYRVTLKLNDIAQRFSAGHRLRLSLSTSYWPLAWPPREPVRLRVETEHSLLSLPERASRADDATIGFAPAESVAASPVERHGTPHHNWRVIRDLANHTSTFEVINDDATQYFPDLELQRSALEWYSSHGNDFNSVRGETFWRRGLKRREWSVRTETRTVLISTPSHFPLYAQLNAYEGEHRVFAETWNEAIERDGV
jgi:hypothetical protein